MRTHRMTLSLAALALVGGCSRGADSRTYDALKTDLALAAQARPYQAQQFTSPAEQQLAANAPGAQYNAGAPAYRTPAPVYRAPARRTYSRTRISGRSSGRYYPSEPVSREPIRHTGRDAAIGATAGAIIGATTSQDRVRGGLIGAAAGGILGGIIGHTVDVKQP